MIVATWGRAPRKSRIAAPRAGLDPDEVLHVTFRLVVAVAQYHAEHGDDDDRRKCHRTGARCPDHEWRHRPGERPWGFWDELGYQAAPEDQLSALEQLGCITAEERKALNAKRKEEENDNGHELSGSN